MLNEKLDDEFREMLEDELPSLISMKKYRSRILLYPRSYDEKTLSWKYGQAQGKAALFGADLSGCTPAMQSAKGGRWRL